jgi:hypothetical protein
MRRAALLIACVLAGTAVAVAMAAGGSQGSAPGTADPMTLTTSNEDGAQLRPGPHGMWGYWGQFATGNPTDEGVYRATCVALGPTVSPLVRRPTYAGNARAATTPDERLTCDVVLIFGGDSSPFGGTLVVQGLVNKPAANKLFTAASPRLLAITGGAGLRYEAKQGKALPIGQNHVLLSFQ